MDENGQITQFGVPLTKTAQDSLHEFFVIRVRLSQLKRSLQVPSRSR